MSIVGDCHIDLENVGATNLVARCRCNLWFRAVAPTDCCSGKFALLYWLYFCASVVKNYFDAIALVPSCV